MGKRNSKAGSLESSDLLVVIEEKELGEELEIVMNSMWKSNMEIKLLESLMKLQH